MTDDRGANAVQPTRAQGRHRSPADLGRRRSAVLAGLLFAAVFSLRVAMPDHDAAVAVLFALPIALVAFAFGRWAGLAAAAFALTLTGVWQVVLEYPTPELAYLTRATTFSCLGWAFGVYAERLRAAERKLVHLADHDHLTGLANRRRFDEALEQHLSEAARYGREGAVLLVDLDHLKAINDTHGHAAGDEALRHVATTLSGRLRMSDVVARLGGDEFAVILPEATRLTACEVAETLADAVRTSPAPLPDGTLLPCTVSIGIALLPPFGTARESELLLRADRALYVAKRAGRDRVEIAETSLDVLLAPPLPSEPARD